MDSAMPVHTLSLNSALRLLKHDAQNGISATPQKSLPVTSKLLQMISASSRRDLRTQEAVKELDVPNEPGSRPIKTL
jgi:hypothetical protein